MPDQELIDQLTRGFSGIRDDFKKRDESDAKLSERLGLVEYIIGEQNRTLTSIQSDMSKAETVQMKMRVEALEKAHQEVEDKQKENAKWIKGLIASVVILVLTFILNFIRVGLK